MVVPHTEDLLRTAKEGRHRVHFGAGVIRVCGAPGTFRDPHVSPFHWGRYRFQQRTAV